MDTVLGAHAAVSDVLPHKSGSSAVGDGLPQGPHVGAFSCASACAIEAAGARNDLAERIARALSGNPYLPKRRVRVETHAGRVVLRGVVHSYFQKQMAQEALRKIEGVEEICNELEVVA